ncbi:hypothetical protein QUF70_04790 [Desulfobacterales bacterium HSG17]|nr:hypothetical protein [Desulfobacterales bacterium HSG17]
MNGLISASKIIDPGAAEVIVEKIRKSDNVLAQALDELLREFRFDVLQELLDQDLMIFMNILE